MTSKSIRALVLAGATFLNSTAITPAPVKAAGEIEAVHGFLTALLNNPVVETANAYTAITTPSSARNQAQREQQHFEMIATVAANQAKITEKLATLGFVLRDNLRQNFLEDTVQSLRGQMFAYGVLRTLPASAEKEVAGQRIARDIDRIAANIFLYDNVAVMPAYIASLGALTLVHRGIGSSPETVRAALSPHYNNLNAYLTPTVSAGVAGQKAALQGQNQRNTEFLNSGWVYPIGRLDHVALSDKQFFVSSQLYEVRHERTPQGGYRLTTAWTQVEKPSQGYSPQTGTRYYPNVTPGNIVNFASCLGGNPQEAIPVPQNSANINVLPPTAEASRQAKVICVTELYNRVGRDINANNEKITRLTEIEQAVAIARDAMSRQVNLVSDNGPRPAR